VSDTLHIPDLIGRIGELSSVLEEETALLDALDLTGATLLLLRKEEAVASLQTAAEQLGDGEELTEEDTALVEESKAALQAQAEANQAALLRSLDLQNRLMQTIAKAIPAGRAEEAPAYQLDGKKMPARPPEAYAFQSRM
jgi:hypothetical protein